MANDHCDAYNPRLLKSTPASNPNPLAIFCQITGSRIANHEKYFGLLEESQHALLLDNAYIMFRLSNNIKKKFFIVGRKIQRCSYSSLLSIDEEIREANERCKDTVIVKEAGSRGWGVYAEREFSKGEIVLESQALNTSSIQDTHTIQTDWGTHVFMDLPARFANHMCASPNLGLRPNEKGAYAFIALESIKTNDELVWDYETTEYQFSFECSCGAPNCRGHLKGFRFHGDEVLKSIGKEFVAPYLLSSAEKVKPDQEDAA